MAGQYERVNARDEDDHGSHETTLHQNPSSPPPSFRSRASSPTGHGQVNQDLADAFDDDDDDSDDDIDDRQRLVRQNATPSGSSDTDEDATQDTSNGHYAPSAAIPSSANSRFVGGGVGSDGVFANMAAKPDRTESEKDEQPPTYEQAAADSAPPYWETTILAPGLGGLDEVYVDGLPVGSVFSFIWNGMIATSFQFVGFLLTYLLHSTHAAKNGSLAGLGITLIQYGFTLKGGADDVPPTMKGPDGYAAPPDPNSHEFDTGDVVSEDVFDNFVSGGGWFSYVLMIAGWFILIKSMAEFLRARRHEQLVLQAPDRGLNVPIIAEGESVDRIV